MEKKKPWLSFIVITLALSVAFSFVAISHLLIKSGKENPSASIDISISDNDGNNDSIYLKKVDINVAAADDNSAFNSAKTTALQSGIMYKAQIPLNLLLQGKNSRTIYVVGHSEIKTTANDNPQVTSKAYKTFNIQRVGLADLD